MSRIVAKFGGSSVADAGQLRKVRAICEQDPRRRLIVPSAPGKRHPDEAKLTDLFYLCQEMAAMHTDCSQPWALIRERYEQIVAELRIDMDISAELESCRKAIAGGCSRDFAASRGEYLCGRLLAAWMDAEFVDPADCIRVTETGKVDPLTYEMLAKRLHDVDKLYVVPGFYGSGPDGNIKTFSRGGSDITGAIVARASNAQVYENWTDVSGFLMADPRIVPGARHMNEVSYREIRELSYMGASVFHDEAILPVKQAGIPIHIRNTNSPDEPGTRIVPVLSSAEVCPIAGIAGKKNFTMIALEKSLMNKEIGFGARLLNVLERHEISFEHCPSSIDTMSVILEEQQLHGKMTTIVEELRQLLEPDKIELVTDLALIAVVGEELVHTIGMAARVFTALRDAAVNVRLINQGASELNIIVGVHSDDYETAVRALYHAFLE